MDRHEGLRAVRPVRHLRRRFLPCRLVHSRRCFETRPRTFRKNRVFIGSASWSTHIFRSNHVVVEGIKIFSGADGIDPDNSQDVVLRSVFVHSNDDAIAVKATVAGSSTEQVAPLAARAAWSLTEWTDMKDYVQYVPYDTYDGAFFRAVLSIHDGALRQGHVHLERTASLLADGTFHVSR